LLAPHQQGAAGDNSPNSVQCGVAGLCQRLSPREGIQIKAADKKSLRNTLVRYIITTQGLHGGSEVVNDLG
jgi:hypothetical protein